MSSKGSLPTLVLVHGSWHSPAHFEPITTALENHGYKCLPVSLPSTQNPDIPPMGLEDDTSAIRSTVIKELEINNVVLVAHSYGGCPANNALKDLDQTTRSRNNHSTSVQSLIFLTAIPLPPQSTFLGAMGGTPHPIHDLSNPQFSWVGPPGPEHWFYNTQTLEDAAHWSSLLKHQSWRAYTDETSYAAYRDLPAYYLKCMKDQALGPEWQDGLVEGMRADGAMQINVDEGGKLESRAVEVMERGRANYGWWWAESDHTPFLGAAMEKTVAFIRRAVEGEEK